MNVPKTRETTEDAANLIKSDRENPHFEVKQREQF